MTSSIGEEEAGHRVRKNRLHSNRPRRLDFFHRVGNKQELIWRMEKEATIFL